MTRLRVAFALITLSLALGAMPAASGQETPPAEGGPVVIVGEEAEPPAEEAWTFRFLVPTLLALTGAVVAGVVLAYGVRIKARYRVSR
jgi:hypothetical protein